MRDWREQLLRGGADLQELSDEGMAVTRIMRSLSAKRTQIGDLCRQLHIPYNEEDTTFKRAVSIFRAVYADADLVQVFDVKSGKDRDEFVDSLLDDRRTAIVFYRTVGSQAMTAFVKGPWLMTSPLGQVVIQPPIRFVRKNDVMEVWEADPDDLLRTFKRKET